MRITFISDTHGKHHELNEQLPGGDVLVHCGDISNVGRLSEIENFLRWFEMQDYEHTIFVAGNHDFGFENTTPAIHTAVSELLNSYVVTYLQDSSVTINGVKFYGSPWTPIFNNWAFNMTQDQLKDKWVSIPDDTDVLITHGPPKGILDKTREGLSVGDPDLLQALSRVQPKIHAFGHIHEAAGIYEFVDGIILVNASSANRNYQIVNSPIIINI
jgi:Icc-related predicted phosphoesterase